MSGKFEQISNVQIIEVLAHDYQFTIIKCIQIIIFKCIQIIIFKCIQIVIFSLLFKLVTIIFQVKEQIVSLRKVTNDFNIAFHQFFF